MTEYHFVEHLPDLIQEEEYAADPQGRRVRIRITASGDGLEILGDAVRLEALERLLESLEPEVIEQTLCG